MKKAWWLLISIGAIMLLMTACGEEPASRKMGRIRGVASAPVEETYVYVYGEDMDLFGPPLTTAGPTEKDGLVELELPPGRYIFVARKRVSGQTSGPVLGGDYRSQPVGPIEVRPGEAVDLSFLLEMKAGEDKSLPFREEQEARTGITGLISDSEGNPVAGARVHVYTYVQMSERPKYVSNETGPDGRYVIFFPEGGTYYLAARNRFGGPPKLGDLYGRYDDGTIDPSAVIVHDGEILEGVDITVHRVW